VSEAAPTSTVEQYIKTIYQEADLTVGTLVQMKRIAEAMEVTPGTATSMVKHLHGRGLVDYQPRRGVSLTDDGRRLALLMLRRHRLIETFLEQVMGYDWAEVHDDAERLEHAVSDRFVKRLDAYLGYPSVDPHGDPIPSAEGEIDTTQHAPLSAASTSSEYEVVRVTDDNPDFLALLKENGLLPGERLVVERVDKTARTLRVRHQPSGGEFVMAFEVGAKILVSPIATT
jgi:DtxR family Mn-dependent transcriptional regulator